MVEDSSGEPFADFMAKAVLHPLGMNHSTFKIMLPMKPNPEFATAHHENGQPVEGRWNRHPESTATGLRTTAGDLARYVIELQQARVGKSNKVLSQKMAEEMLTPQKGDAGLGIFLVGQGRIRHFTHNGANVGFRSLFVGFTEEGEGIAILANSDSGGPLIQEILQSVGEAYQWPTHLRGKKTAE